MTTGELIKKRRKELGITADELGAKIGVNRSTIYRYENGDIEKVPISVLEPLAKALYTTAEYLMGLGKEAQTSDNDYDEKILKLFTALPADKQKQALDYLRFLAEHTDNL